MEDLEVQASPTPMEWVAGVWHRFRGVDKAQTVILWSQTEREGVSLG